MERTASEKKIKSKKRKIKSNEFKKNSTNEIYLNITFGKTDTAWPVYSSININLKQIHFRYLSTPSISAWFVSIRLDTVLLVNSLRT